MKKKLKKRSEDGEAIRWLWLIGGEISGYATVEVVLRGQSHSWHWIVTLVVGVIIYLGIVVGQKLQRRS